MLYRSMHTTRYTYEGPVAQCMTEVRLKPRVGVGGRQLVKEWKLRIMPEPASVMMRVDYFGNEVATFAVLEPHDRLVITASSLVEVHAPAALAAEAAELSWETARAAFAKPVDKAIIEACEFRWASTFVPLSEGLVAFGRPSFTPGRPLVEVARDLMRRIHKEFRYVPNATSIDTPLAEVLSKKKGVCQDFAHVMIGALRIHGLAARYVSGYLRSGAAFQGAEASHAWVSVCIPGFGWMDFDPTNDMVPGEGHVTLAWGRDYGDVTPVRGVTLGGGDQTVEVAVRVQPA